MIEKWLVKFVQILNLPFPAPHFLIITKHLGKIRLHLTNLELIKFC